MRTETLVAGLIGAITSSALGFFARWYLDHRAKQQAEQQAAYVHLVAITEVVALDCVLRALLSTHFYPARVEALKTNGENFEASHAASVLIHEALSKLSPDQIAKRDDVRFFARILRRIIEDWKSRVIESSELVSLPREVVATYRIFSIADRNLRQCAEFWLDLAEHGQGTWFAAETIHQHWLLLRSYMKTANKLRVGLRQASAISHYQMDALFWSMADRMLDDLMFAYVDRPKLEAARAAIKRFQGEGDDVGKSHHE